MASHSTATPRASFLYILQVYRCFAHSTRYIRVSASYRVQRNVAATEPFFSPSRMHRPESVTLSAPVLVIEIWHQVFWCFLQHPILAVNAANQNDPSINAHFVYQYLYLYISFYILFQTLNHACRVHRAYAQYI